MLLINVRERKGRFDSY